MVTINNQPISIQMVTFQKMYFMHFLCCIGENTVFPYSFTCTTLIFKIRPILSFSQSTCSAIFKKLGHNKKSNNQYSDGEFPKKIFMHFYAVSVASAYTVILQGQTLFPKCSKMLQNYDAKHMASALHQQVQHAMHISERHSTRHLFQKIYLCRVDPYLGRYIIKFYFNLKKKVFCSLHNISHICKQILI